MGILANRVLDYIEETESRLGMSSAWMGRPLKRARRVSRVAGVTGLTVLLTVAPELHAQTPVHDAIKEATDNAIAAQTAASKKISDFWKENQDNMRWTTDLLQAYRNIKVMKAAYSAAANFNIMDHLSLVDIGPSSLPIPEGQLFGGDGGLGTTIVDGGHAYKQTSLAVQMHYTNGGVAATFKDIPAFKPNFKIDFSKIADSLKNLDFDVAESTQHFDSATGHPLGSAQLRTLGPNERLGKVFSYVNDIINTAQNWESYVEKKKAAQKMIDDETAQMYAELDAATAAQRKKLERERTLATAYLQSTDTQSPYIPAPAEATKTEDYWAFQKAEIDAEHGRQLDILKTKRAQAQLKLDQLSKASVLARRTGAGAQSVAVALSAIKAAEAAIAQIKLNSDAALKKILEDDKELKKNDPSISEILVGGGSGPSLTEDGKKKYEAQKASAADAIQTETAKRDSALATVNQARLLDKESADMQALDSRFQEVALGNQILLKQNLRDLDEYLMKQRMSSAALWAAAEKDALDRNRKIVENLKAVEEAYSEAFLQKTGSGKGFAWNVMTQAFTAYARGLKLAFGSARVGDLVSSDDADAKANGIEATKTFVNASRQVWR